MHPFAIEHPIGHKSAGNSGAWNEVCSGDQVIYLIDGRTGVLDECMHDGEAFVTWDDGTYGVIKWHHLAPKDKVKVVGGHWEAIR
jgi:hypothetical protein